MARDCCSSPRRHDRLKDEHATVSREFIHPAVPLQKFQQTFNEIFNMSWRGIELDPELGAVAFERLRRYVAKTTTK